MRRLPAFQGAPLRVSRLLLHAAAAGACALLVACGGGSGPDPGKTVDMPLPMGNIMASDRELDVAIAGPGLFAFVDEQGQPVYARTARLDVDRAGYLVNAEGWRLAGRTDDSTPSDVAAPLPAVAYTRPGHATTRVALVVNLDSRAGLTQDVFDPADANTFTNGFGMVIYDAHGVGASFALYFAHVATDRWRVHAMVAGQWLATPVAELEIGLDGRARDAALSPPFNVPAGVGSDGVSPTAAFVGLQLDWSGTTQYGTNYSVSSVDHDGYAPGKLTGVTVEATGHLLARYDSGPPLPAGQLLLARFAVGDELQSVGDTGMRCVRNCSAPIIAPPLQMLLGSVKGGAQEELP